jgi:hypothetical protein
MVQEKKFPAGRELQEIQNVYDLQKVAFKYLRWSGKYVKSKSTLSMADFRIEKERIRVLREPVYKMSSPVVLQDQPEITYKPWSITNVTLHVDIDGTDPLAVVSGTISRQTMYTFGTISRHFIGQVTSRSGLLFADQTLVVENFEFTWPTTSTVVNRCDIVLSNIFNPSAEATFVSADGSKTFGPYALNRKSPYFHEVEFEIDTEDDALTVQPYNLHTHPDRPDDLSNITMNIQSAYAKAGIKVNYSSESNVINTVGSGGEGGWTRQELHDAMEDHWSAFENVPQWKMWVFIAETAQNGYAGWLFDSTYDEPGGVDRQGTAVFTNADWLFDATADIPSANPPSAEAVERDLFFVTVHEIGHGFNLYHPFGKVKATPWTPPDWADPIINDDQALTFMNYPWKASPGDSEKWFYDRFNFRFTDGENLFLRHAPPEWVQMGNEDWGINHGIAQAGKVDNRLELKVRTRRNIFEMGEAVFVELRLKNISNTPLPVHSLLDPEFGYVAIGITGPDGKKLPYVPLAHADMKISPSILEPGNALYQPVYLNGGRYGFHFKKPGAYRLDVVYTNGDGTQVPSVAQLWVREAASTEEQMIISELYNARTGCLMYAGGSRIMEDVNDKLEWICRNLPPKHPAGIYLRSCLASPYAQPFKVLTRDTKKVRKAESDPSQVIRHLKPVTSDLEMAADSLGHITLRSVIGHYTSALVESGKKSDARDSLSKLIALYRKRGVISSAIKEREEELAKMK